MTSVPSSVNEILGTFVIGLMETKGKSQNIDSALTDLVALLNERPDLIPRIKEHAYSAGKIAGNAIYVTPVLLRLFRMMVSAYRRKATHE